MEHFIAAHGGQGVPMLHTNKQRANWAQLKARGPADISITIAGAHAPVIRHRHKGVTPGQQGRA